MSSETCKSSTAFKEGPEATSLTERHTVLSSSLNDRDPVSDSEFVYRASISPRITSFPKLHNNVLPGPVSPGIASSGSNYVSRIVEYSSVYTSPLITNISNQGVKDFKYTREKEKKDMRDLNERFANYIEKTRFFQAQNRKLAGELDDLKANWGKETSAVKMMYNCELEEARKIIEGTIGERNNLLVKVGQLEGVVENLKLELDEAKKWRGQDREVINKLNQQITDLEAEVRSLRRSNDSLETERLRDKGVISRLHNEIEKLRAELSNETILRLDAENRAQTLVEEMDFQKSVHEQELKELAALAYRDTTAENREFWKNELSQVVRDIQAEYDSKIDAVRCEMETFYNLKIQEYRTSATKQNMDLTQARDEARKIHKILSDWKVRVADLEARNAQLEKQYQDLLRELESKEHDYALENNQLRDDTNKLRTEMESMLIELQTLMDTKLSMELEIAAYRKLLEVEENRVGLRSVVEQTLTVRSSGSARLADITNVNQEGNDSHLSMKMMRGEMSAKTTYQRTATGPVAISETCALGKFIQLENNPSSGVRKDINVGDWMIRQEVDDKGNISYKIPAGTIVKSGKSLKVWASGFSAQANIGTGDVVNRSESQWGTGSKVITTLLNEKSEEKASHTQQTLYS